MEPFTKALEVVARVIRDGAATYPDKDWVRCSPEGEFQLTNGGDFRVVY